MPRIDKRPHRDRAAALMARWADFKRGFKPGRKNPHNVWREYDGATVCVFMRLDGYAWSICDGDGLRFSPRVFGSQSEAMDDLGRQFEDLQP